MHSAVIVILEHVELDDKTAKTLCSYAGNKAIMRFQARAEQ